MSTARDVARWAERRSRNECGRCGSALAAGYAKANCPPCLARVADLTWKTYVRGRGLIPAFVARRYRPQKTSRASAADQRNGPGRVMP